MNDQSFTKSFPNGNQAMALYVDPQTSASSIAEALDLPVRPPVLLLSGGAGGMSDREMKRLSPFMRAIGNVLAQEHAIILDGGTDSGVMAAMGQALERAGHEGPHIGVLPAYADAGLGGPVGQDVLDPRHTHFVLVKSNQWGDEIQTMGDLSILLAGGSPPLVMLANGGGISLLDVEWHVKRGHQIVVLVGTGRLADEIAQAVRHPKRRARERVVALVQEGRLCLFDLKTRPAELAESLRNLLKGQRKASPQD